ncbi:ERG4/ERG24 ergosterol biosynthesis protein [Dothidotthia symphoricarpi CBS 119687]|uniref:Delta(14)-sterol reductase n=1 Tax=Dothidotthia symphoricarpi CBS 119687 TaxID=1392245 RepID=A0A6A6AAK1_9PLEO|nr:ERG4/ERG24 ergosterol biosynthesis protein [Dothidotthia symphoricarpi CBS 119687]KAF2128830.1 ERG4/ERG24 ergosterol biosynthesis protein [Dothidotthia symphoricarpi CBS 119687]
MTLKEKPGQAKAIAEQPHGYEFLGPPGAFVISFGLPLLVYVFTFLCNDISGCPAPSLLHPSSLTLDQLKTEVGWTGFSGLLNTQAVLGTLGYYLLSLTLHAFLPADETEGTELRTGGKLKYRFNSFSSAVLIMVGLGAGTVMYGAEWPVWTFITENYVGILTTNILISYFLATYVYLRSFSVKHPKDPSARELAAGGHTGNILYDWFIGRELNPRITVPMFGEVDIKAWCELRPGMLGWIILDLAFIMKQYRNFGRVTDSILLITVAQAVYTFDALFMERAILTTIDIIADGFGMMLSFGDLVWVPFTYSIQARYLSVYPVDLGVQGILAVLAVQGTGYYIFRSVNNEKNRFRTDPTDPRVSHLEFIETAAGSKLLVSGWWGRARHINYLGDWFMSWSYVLPTALSGYVIQNAVQHPVTATQTDAFFFRNSYGTYVVPGEAKGWGMIFTYFFMVYFAVLLIHRERRDEEKCRRKYGKDWDKYCELVPWRIVPYVY